MVLGGQVAESVNTLVDNIGARRLHTILERILEEISFSAPEQVWIPGLAQSAELGMRPQPCATR
jgi:hypothetical protein